MEHAYSPIVARALTGLFLLITAAIETARGQTDYSAELPRVAARSPAEAMHAFEIVNGYRIELVASEPLVVDPVALAFDADQTLYVVEMRGYSEDEELHLSRIRRLTDSDGDGSYDQSPIFAEGFGWPTAVTCWKGGIFVAAAPDLLYLQDTDGDGRADQQTVMVSGFGRSNVQGLVNSLQWGPDQRIHGVTSSSGAELQAPSLASDKLVTLRGRDFAFDPSTLVMEGVSGGGQHGMSFDDEGTKFVCSNSDHIQQVIFEDHYWNRNPFALPPPSRLSIATDGPQADVFRISPIEPWRLVRTRLRVAGVVPGPVEGGGRPAGYFTSATGVTIVRGAAFQHDPMFGMAVVADVGSNLVHRKRLSRDGVRYRADRIDEKSEFLRSRDIWFRPVQMTNGPDGGLYLLDMYREVIEHPASLPPEIKQHLDLTSGRDRGRIYRVVPEGFRRPEPVRLEHATIPSLVAALQQPNAWHQETAARLLLERNAREAIPELQSVVVNDQGMASWRALQVIASLDGLSVDLLLQALTHASSATRRHAITLSESMVGESAELRAALYRCVDDPEADVRHRLAYALGHFPPEKRVWQALAELARRASEDRYQLAAVQSSLVHGAAVTLSELGQDANFLESNQGKAFIAGLASQLERQFREPTAEFDAAWRELAPLVGESFTSQQLTVWSLVLPELARRADSPWSAALRSAKEGRFWSKLLESARSRAMDSDLSFPERQAAAGLLAVDDWNLSEPVFKGLLQPTQPKEVQEAALNALRQTHSEAAAQMLLSRWTELSPSLRTRAFDWLTSFPAGQQRLVQAIRASDVSAAEISVGQRNQLAQVLSPTLWAEIETIVATPAESPDRQAVQQTYREMLQTSADVDAGRTLFRKVCAECHRLEETGHEIGPNLVTLQNRGAETILLNVLEPNREVNPQYVNYVATTEDGRVMSGMIQGETATSLTLVRAGNQTDTILRNELESLRSTGVSLMPSGLDQQISPEAMRDLIGYILSLR